LELMECRRMGIIITGSDTSSVSSHNDIVGSLTIDVSDLIKFVSSNCLTSTISKQGRLLILDHIASGCETMDTELFAIAMYVGVLSSGTGHSGFQV
jgi:hypothetical protein